MSKDVIGSVMVVGGGIGGIQSALDLANAGFYVHLVEKTSAIGGVMSALDKTFPTNDCSMCILSPKLVEVGRHINIELHTCSNVESIDGESGNFQVTLHKDPRYIDSDKCTGCGDCAEICPVTMPSEYDMALADRKATYKRYAQAIPGSFAIEKLDTAPCRLACPANLNVQGYVAMVKMGKYREAIEIIMKDLPLPGILGRICPHKCEKSCRRLELDEAVSIRELKRVAADQVNLADIPVPQIIPKDEKVAVIGSGPAGLTAAYFLALDGYQVGVYESMPETGGMMRYGIPEYRLPRTVLDAEIENLKRYGIQIHTNTAIGKDITLEELREHGAKAIFLAIGAWKGLKLRIPGEKTSEGVSDVTTFLREVHLRNLNNIQGKVVVIGGGHSALDAAQTALRLGADEAHIIYRRSRDEMLAEPEEVIEAEKEGVKIHFLVAPLSIAAENDKVTGIECIRTRLTEKDTTGRRRPIPVEGSEFFIKADHIIPAIGQEPDFGDLNQSQNLKVSKWNLLEVHPETLQTNIPDIFAGGDVISGPATVIEAVEAGRRAAKYMAMYLQGQELPTVWQEEPPMGTNWAEIPADEPARERLKIPMLPVEKRLAGFEEVAFQVDEDSARQEADRCLDCGSCCECFQCVTACDAKAVTLESHARQAEKATINVGSVILAPGFQPFDPGGIDRYGYGVFPNVVTSMELERILSASGPFEGHLIRPSDNQEPKKIAWLQCIGSRDTCKNSHEYCSGVCCMYAIKQTLVAKEHAGGDLETAIFFMDMRAHGKGFEQTYNRAKDEAVRFVRTRVHTVEPVPETGDLRIRYVTENGRLITETFNMMVLSVGLEISEQIKALADKLDIQMDTDGFAATGSDAPVVTSRPGVFVCGAFAGPKDIPQTVMEASAAAAASTGLLSGARNTLTKEKTYPNELPVAGDDPRIGVFVCHCGTNIGGIVDVPSVKKYAESLPKVVFAADNLFTCSQDTQEIMRRAIRENNLNRVVVAACTPRTHEPLFQETIQEAGLNPYLFEFANIRDQNSWVHQHNPEEATRKAKDLLDMAVAKASLLEPIEPLQIEVDPNALVIGGGIAGMSAALNLAEQGFKTYLVERKSQLGGHALSIRRTWKGEDVGAFVNDYQNRVKAHENIEVLPGAEILNIDGFVGNFTTTLQVKDTHREIRHGAVILATGGRAFEPDEYLYGQSERVMKWHEIDDLLENEPQKLEKAKGIAFIQCVGSREPDRPYCSKICCTSSVQSAIRLKNNYPDIRVYILYRDIRTFGRREKLYRQARELGVVFIRYAANDKPVVEKNGDNGLLITIKDPVLEGDVQIQVDYLNLASAILPTEGQKQIAQMLKVPINDEGFYLEAHVKLRPVDFSTDGVFVCGLAHYPKPIEESIAQAQAAAGRAAGLLGQKTINIKPIVSIVDEQKCIGCGLCEISCSFAAIRLKLVEGQGYRAENYSALCKGCGVCAAACPQQAIDMKHFREKQIRAAIQAGGTA